MSTCGSACLEYRTFCACLLELCVLHSSVCPFDLQRLMRDFKRLRNDPPQGINGSPNPDNIMHWNAVIFGPEDTPWDGGAHSKSCSQLV